MPPYPTLQDKVIAITGAASGIGLATAYECASRGATLALSDLNIDVLKKSVETLQSEFPSLKVTASHCDVSVSSSVDTWITDTVTHFGRIDGACNIAGVEGKPGMRSDFSIVDTTDDYFDFIQKINVNGTFYCVRAQLRVMKDGSSIVNMSSGAGLRGTSNFSSYSTSKHGVIGLTKCAAQEAGPMGVRVNAVCPGPIDTPLLRRMCEGAPERWKWLENAGSLPGMGKPQDVAHTFVWLLGDDSRWTNGAAITVDGGSR